MSAEPLPTDSREIAREQSKRLRLKPGPPLSNLVRKFVKINGRPFDFKGRHFQISTYELPQDRVVLKTGRQCEKSTSIASRLAIFSAYYPGMKSIYVAPRDEQARSFSSKRFTPIIRGSPGLRWLLNGKGVVDSVKDKRYSNASTVAFRSAFRDPDSVRGESADILALDEYQDLQRDHIPVLEETQGHATRRRQDGSLLKLRWYTGTPKSYDNPLEERWKGSTQCMWVVHCEACRYYNEEIGIEHIGPNYLQCRACKRPIHPWNGFWKAYGDLDAEFAGFHYNVLLYPWCDWKDIHEKLGGENAYSDRMFMNEVLGYSFDSGAKVITLDELKMACAVDRKAFLGRPQGRPVVFCGVDWGGTGTSTTVWHAGTWADGRYKVFAMRRWPGTNPEEEIKEIAKCCLRVKANFVACDLGAGVRANQDLASQLPGNVRVIQFHNNHSLSTLVRWNKNADMYVISKPRTMARMFTALKRKPDSEIEFPCWEDSRPFMDDLACVYEEYNPRSRMITYDHPATKPDDFAHSLNLGKLACDIYYKKIKHIDMENVEESLEGFEGSKRFALTGGMEGY